MIRTIPITNVGIAIPTAAKPESTALRTRFGQIAPATEAGTAIRSADQHRHEREQERGAVALLDERR